MLVCVCRKRLQSISKSTSLSSPSTTRKRKHSQSSNHEEEDDEENDDGDEEKENEKKEEVENKKSDDDEDPTQEDNVVARDAVVSSSSQKEEAEELVAEEEARHPVLDVKGAQLYRNNSPIALAENGTFVRSSFNAKDRICEVKGRRIPRESYAKIMKSTDLMMTQPPDNRGSDDVFLFEQGAPWYTNTAAKLKYTEGVKVGKNRDTIVQNCDFQYISGKWYIVAVTSISAGSQLFANYSQERECINLTQNMLDDEFEKDEEFIPSDEENN